MIPLDTGSGGDEQADAALQPNPVAIRTHLERLFRRVPDEYPGGLIEIAWSDPSGNVTFANLFEATPEGIEAAIECALKHNRDDTLNRRNVYVGVNPRKPGTKLWGRASAQDVEIAVFNFADADGSPATDKLLEAPLAYSFAVTTGHRPEWRTHVYWELEEPTRDMAAWSARQTGIRDYFGSDAVLDPPRVMRLAGTISYPPQHKVSRGYVIEQVTIQTLYAPGLDGDAEEREPVSSDALAASYPAARWRASDNPQFDPDTGEVHDDDRRKGSKFGTGHTSVDELLIEIKAGREWHNNSLKLVAHLVGKGHSDALILALAPEITLPGYTVERTRAELKTMIAGARRKGWDEQKSDETNSDWPDPDLSLLASEALPAPPFPEVLPVGWGKWAIDAAEGAGAPVDYVVLHLLSAVSTLIGNARWGQPWEGWQEPPVLFTAAIGLPSSNKSPALKVITDLLSRLEKSLNDDWGERRRAYKRDCAAAKERRSKWESEVKEAVKGGRPPPDMPLGAEDPELPQPHRLFSTEPTVQKAALLVHGNPRGLLLVRDELAGWVGGMDLYSGGDGHDRAFWLQAYNGGYWAPDRVKDGENAVIIPHLAWGLTGGIQPDRVRSKLLAGDDDGLAARIIYSWPVPVPLRRPRVQPDMAGALVALRRLIELPWHDPPEPAIFPLTEAAADALQALREEVADLERGAAGLFLSWLGKLPGFCVRLAVILQHLEWCWKGHSAPPIQISEHCVAVAADFLENYAIPMARRVFDEAALPQAERDARVIARWLAAQKPVPEVVNERDLRRMRDGPSIGDTARLTAALNELAEAGWVRSAPARARGHGRPRRDWAVNPAARSVAQ